MPFEAEALVYPLRDIAPASRHLTSDTTW